MSKPRRRALFGGRPIHRTLHRISHRSWIGGFAFLLLVLSAFGQGGGLTGPPTIAPPPPRRAPPPEQRVETPLPPPRPTP